MDSEEEMAPMARKPYSEEFKADAIALYRSNPGLTYAQVARDLGMNAETVRQWVRDAGAAPGPDGRIAPAAGPERAGGTACRRAVFRWLTRYNTWRRHLTNGQLCPIDYEREHALTSDSLGLTA
ncbi:transposase [Streptomyces sp. H27-C3]|uniref:transposase n=1 Tax=Streptomyces sp. H27-C3 TaxID=3046305 RepID=UPI0024BA0D04|nr:transposase [Streptomyces sp. H27-C3]MDJ0466224.1 transposase [Streptomyces sp. H27-C3]